MKIKNYFIVIIPMPTDKSIHTISNVPQTTTRPIAQTEYYTV